MARTLLFTVAALAPLAAAVGLGLAPVARSATLANVSAYGHTGETLTVERPIEAMIRIPAGPFKMGASDEAAGAALKLCRDELGRQAVQDCDFSNEGPEREVYLSGFAIDRVEVTVSAWRACARAGRCSPAPLLALDRRLLAPELPITHVSWDDAAAYCRFRGARLPSEAEWERAARGTDGRTFPWGNIPNDKLSNHGRFHTVGALGPQPLTLVEMDAQDGYALLAPVGAFPRGASPDGVLGMAGNVMEWTSDVYAADPPEKASSVNPRGPKEGPLRAVRGGSFRQPLLYQRTTARNGFPPEFRSPELGFRCAR